MNSCEKTIAVICKLKQINYVKFHNNNIKKNCIIKNEHLM